MMQYPSRISTGNKTTLTLPPDSPICPLDICDIGLHIVYNTPFYHIHFNINPTFCTGSPALPLYQFVIEVLPYMHFK